MSRKYNRPWLTNGLHIERVSDEEVKTVLARKAELQRSLLSEMTMRHTFQKQAFAPLSATVPIEAIARTCIGCGRRVLPAAEQTDPAELQYEPCCH
jgi:hypothetical protein